jgi:uncharacterized membrane protein
MRLAAARPDRSSLFWPGVLVGDGLFHILSTAVLVIGVIRLVERRRASPDRARLALAGALLLRRTRQPTP